jgi:hypothetical protein
LREARENLRAKVPRALPMLETFCSELLQISPQADPAIVHRVATTIALKDAPVVARAIAARATHLATYDRRHPLTKSDHIRSAYGIEVDIPSAILAAATRP